MVDPGWCRVDNNSDRQAAASFQMFTSREMQIRMFFDSMGNYGSDVGPLHYKR